MQTERLGTRRQEMEGAWETVWVNENGSEVILDEDTEIPDKIEDANLLEAKVSILK